METSVAVRRYGGTAEKLRRRGERGHRPKQQAGTEAAVTASHYLLLYCRMWISECDASGTRLREYVGVTKRYTAAALVALTACHAWHVQPCTRMSAVQWAIELSSSLLLEA